MMKNDRLSEDLFRLLQEGDAAVTKESPIHHLARVARDQVPETPPPVLWKNIQDNLTHTPVKPKLVESLRQLLSPPTIPAFALALVVIIGASFFLINRATEPAQVPLVDITASVPQKKGTVILAQGLRIEATALGNIRRIAGKTEKIVFQSGTWTVALKHNELAQRTQFVFPGGALEPLGTAFTVNITPTETAINLTEGKIRLMEYESAKNAWRTSEVSAPFRGVVNAEQIFDETPDDNTTKALEKPRHLSRYANLAGKQVAIELKNGDRISGRLKSAMPGKLVLDAPAGTMVVREVDILLIKPN